MKQLVNILSIFSMLLFTCSCTYHSSLLPDTTLKDSCTNQKTPMKIGIVVSHSLNNCVVKSSLGYAGDFNAEIRVDETLRKLVHDLFACYFTQVTLVSDTGKFEELDALVYCDYSVKGLTTLLGITLNERKNDFVIADYKQEGSIMYQPPKLGTALGAGTLGLGTPLTTQIAGNAYKDALFDSITESFIQINAKMRVDRRVKGIKRFDTATLKYGMTASEFRNYYGPIKETILNDPFTSNIKYNIILFEALPPLNSKEVNNDGVYTG